MSRRRRDHAALALGAWAAAALVAGAASAADAVEDDAAAAGVDAGPASTGASDPALELRLGTATAGGGFEPLGRALAEAVRGADPSIQLRAVATAGSVENVARLAAGTLDLGLCTGELAREALAPPSALRVLWAAYPAPALLAVRAGSPYHRLEDLRGKRVVLGARGSGNVALARLVFDGLGLDVDRDLRPVLVERAEDGPRKLLSGEVDAVWGAGIGWPPFEAVASAPGGARFLAPDEAGVERILARHPFLRAMTVPPGSYAGQRDLVRTVGSWSLVLARADLPEAVAYRLARAIHRGGPELRARLPRAGDATATNTAAAVARDELHPGVARYLREQRVLGRAGESP